MTTRGRARPRRPRTSPPWPPSSTSPPSRPRRNPAGSTSCISFPGIQDNYKNQLQMYAQKRGKDVPLYSRIQDGPSHLPRFKSTVTIDGKIFESQQYFPTVKEADQAAANLALMSLTQEASSQNQFPVQAMPYKNSQQNTSSDDSNHSFIAKSTFGTNAKSFEGGSGKTKKQKQIDVADGAFQHSIDIGSQLKQGTENISKQEIKIVGPDSSLPQVPTLTNDEKNDSNVDHDTCSTSSGIHPPLAFKTQSLDEPIQYGNMENDEPAAPEPSIKAEVMDSTPECTFLPIPSRPPTNNSSLASTTRSTTPIALQSPVEPIQSVKMENDKLAAPEPSIRAEVMDSTQECTVLPLASRTPTNTSSVAATSRTHFALQCPGKPVQLVKTENEKPAIPEPSTEAEVMDVTEPSTEAEAMDVPEPSINEEAMDVPEPSINEEAMDVPEPSIKDEIEDSTPEHTSPPSDSRPPTSNSNLAAPTAAMPVTSVGCGESMSTNHIKVYPCRPDLEFPEGVSVLPWSDDQWVAVSIPFSQA